MALAIVIVAAFLSGTVLGILAILIRVLSSDIEAVFILDKDHVAGQTRKKQDGQLAA
jgi:hypothetical protein